MTEYNGGGCFLCGSRALAPVLDVGPQPISNRFLRANDEPEERFPIALQQCETCGLVQIEQPVPAQALVPPFDWITYNEPEPHLDALVSLLTDLPGIGPRAVAAGVSFKDDSTLARLERAGLGSWRVDPYDDLGVPRTRAVGVETIQDRLTPAAADAIVRRRGAADLLIVRHILEHAVLPLNFIEALRILTKPDGYVVIEVPDCSRAMDGGDYTTIWEEHTLYYTPDTFRQGLALASFDVVRTENYPYPFENSLVAIARPDGHHGTVGTEPAIAARERQRAAAFGKGFLDRRGRLRRFLDGARARGPIALFGAGHLACAFVNMFEVADTIDCVIDDNPNKRGLYMPGSKLPIVGSSALSERNIHLCLLSLNPIGEEKVVEKHKEFVRNGGGFASIFPASARTMRL